MDWDWGEQDRMHKKLKTDASRSDYHITQNGKIATHFVVGQLPTDYLLGNTIHISNKFTCGRCVVKQNEETYKQSA